jgi:hypothetical protein
MRGLDPVSLGRVYGVPVIDWGRRGDSLLVAVGFGIMMATMDSAPGLAWAADVGGGAVYPRLGDWLEASAQTVRRVVLVGWFSLSDPRPLAKALARVPAERLLAWSNVPLGVGREFPDLRALVEHLNHSEPQSHETSTFATVDAGQAPSAVCG